MQQQVGNLEAAPADKDVQQPVEANGGASSGNWAKRASIGVNLRVTGHCQQGGRKYMEDYFAVAYQHTHDEKDLEYAYFGIFDGHGGAEAAAYAKENLMEFIVKNPRFWYEGDEEVLQSIKEGFIEIHQKMWKIHDKWPKTASGLPSTAGTTASIAFIRRGKIYVGHVGDSGITLGFQRPGCPDWQAKSLTKDHKPECEDELARIEQSGGKVIAKMGVPRVVWNRPRIGHKGPVRRSTPIDEIPFLAVARSLGDLWSYNASNGEFVVSPEPDVSVHTIDTSTFRCLIFGTDGLYNMLSPKMAVLVVQDAEVRNEEATLSSPHPHWINPSRTLVERALDRWCTTKMRADNTSVITLMLDPPGPPRSQVLRTKRLEREKERLRLLGDAQENVTPAPSTSPVASSVQNLEPDLVGNSCDAPKVKPRESTAFDTRLPYSTTDTNADDDTDNRRHPVDESPAPVPNTVSAAIATADAIANSSICAPSPSLASATESTATPQHNENDIQINEVTSSSFDTVEMDGDKRKKRATNRKMNIIQRKFNLRSNNLHSSAQVDDANGLDKTKKKSSQKALPSSKATRAPLGENVAETSRLNHHTLNMSPTAASESRVLRERRNTTPNSNSNSNVNANASHTNKNTASATKKAKSIAKKMTMSVEKKKLLQNLLFKKDSQEKASDCSTSVKPQRKTKENAKSPPKAASISAPQPAHEHTTRSSIGRRTSERHKAIDAPREMRKSTLKLRMHEGIFKAKVRAQAKIKLTRNKAKGLSLKNYVGS